MRSVIPSDVRVRLAGGLAWLAGVALLLTPLLVDPLAYDDAYVKIKWAWLAFWVPVGLAVAVVRACQGRVLRLPLHPLWWMLAVWVAWHWVGVLWATSRPLAFDRAAQVTWLLLGLTLGLQLIRRRRDLLRMGWILVGVGVVTAGWVLVEDVAGVWFPEAAWIRPNLPDWRGYLSAGLGNTNHLGDLLVLAFVVTLVMFGAARRRAARWGLGVAAVTIPAALIVCYSVGSTLSLLVAAGLMLALVARRDRGRWFLRRRRRWIGLVMVWAVVIGFFVTDHPLNPHRPGILRQGFASERWVAGGSTRLAIWAQTLEMIRQAPVLGVGTGNFTYVFPEMDSSLLWGHPELRAYQGSWTNAAHQELLQMWAELGIVGLFLFLVVIGLGYYAVFRRWGEQEGLARLVRLTLAAMLTAWVVQAQMNFSLQERNPVGALAFFAILTGILAEERIHRARGAMPPLAIERGPFTLQLRWATMRKPFELGLMIRAGWPVAGLLGIVLLVGVFGWAVQCWRPVMSEHAYRRAVAAIQAGRPEAAEAQFQRALRLDPAHVDCRSRYSGWLLERGRPGDALEQLERVRRRLNSNELWMREARAHGMLGDDEAARKALQTYLDRKWLARQRMQRGGAGRPAR